MRVFSQGIPLFSRCIVILSNSRKGLLPKYFIKSVKKPRENEQMEYLKSVIEKNTSDWMQIKNKILNMRGTVNEKNVDAIIIKYLTSQGKFNTAYSFAKYLQMSGNEPNLGVTNSLLNLCYEFSKENQLSEELRKFILESYESLYAKYKVLDYYTSERLLHALCAIDEWKKGLKILDDIHFSSVPSHSTYSVLIATLFKNNKKTEALKIIKRSISDDRPPRDNAYEEWLKYILRKHKDKTTILKHLDEICLHIAENYLKVTETTAEKMKETFLSLDWSANYTSVKRDNGQCVCCNSRLVDLKLTDEEFSLLQQNVKDKLIVGSDLFLKTSPGELERFLKFVDSTGPYDVVLDGLNIAYTIGNATYMNKIKSIKIVVDYFLNQNKKILLLGRKHMYKWHTPTLQEISKKTFSFFTDNISQDDPYFITAAILSGPNTDIVSRDLLRGHKFLLKQDSLRLAFQKWQWTHQWMVHAVREKPFIKAPLKFAPCAQKNDGGWHIPYERIMETNKNYFNSGDPDCSAWLCLREKR